MLLPTNEILHPEWEITPVPRLNVVLLPAPFGPISATISRACTSNETSLTAMTPPNCFRAWSISSNTLGAPGARGRGGNASELSVRLRAGLSGRGEVSHGQ